MSQSVSPVPYLEQREIERTLVQGTARLCISDFGTMLKAVAKSRGEKPAEWLAAKTGQSLRAAAYELAGDREPSARSINFLMSLACRWPL